MKKNFWKYMEAIKEKEIKSNFTTFDYDALQAYAANKQKLENKPTLSEKEKLRKLLEITNKELEEVTQEINSAIEESKKIENEISAIENYGEKIQNSTKEISILFNDFLKLKLSDFLATRNEVIEESPIGEDYFTIKLKNDILENSKTPKELWKNITNSSAWNRDITVIIKKLKTYIENKEIKNKVQKQIELKKEIKRLQSKFNEMKN